MSLRVDIEQVLARWQPLDDEQRDLRDEFVAHVRAHDDAPWRSCQPDHVTASALILSADGEQVALTLHGRLRRWLQTGGHCEPGDLTLVGAAAREALEESGIAGLVVDPVPVLLSSHEVHCWPGGRHLDVQFVAHAPAAAELAISDESLDLQWFGVDDLPADADESVRALVSASTRRRRENPPHARSADRA